MDDFQERCKPLILKRPRGGWMALSGPEAPIRIGTCGRTESEAREAFAELAARWLSAKKAELSAQKPAH